MAEIFNVIETTYNNIEFDNAVMTAHWASERVERHEKIVSIIGNGKCLKSFIVDTNHPNGYEIHNVFDNGIVLIQNKDSQRLVTELIARPQQIKRYWQNLHIGMPIEIYRVIAKAEEHQKKGYNNW